MLKQLHLQIYFKKYGTNIPIYTEKMIIFVYGVYDSPSLANTAVVIMAKINLTMLYIDTIILGLVCLLAGVLLERFCASMRKSD
jgi:hypothetical protein